jgi:hypothetical protein
MIYFRTVAIKHEQVTGQTESVLAIRRIGTNAIPPLLHALRLQYSFMSTQIRRGAPHLPKAIARNRTVRRALALPTEREIFNRSCLEVLGETASPVLPQLLEIANATNSLDACGSAISMMVLIGPPALEPLVSIARNPHHPYRMPALFEIMQIVASPAMTNRCKAAPLIIPFARDKDPVVAVRAIGRFFYFNQCDETPAAAKALVECLADPNPELRLEAARSLLHFSSCASRVVPALLQAVKDDDSKVRDSALKALRTLAPEALTNSAPAQP